MRATGLESLGLRPQRQFRRGFETRATLGTRPALGARGAIGTWATIGGCALAGTAVAGGAGATGCTGATWAWAARAAWSTRAAWTIAALATIGAIAAILARPTVAPVALGKNLGDGLERLVARNQREQSGLLSLLLARRDGEDGDALKLELGVGLHHHSDGGVGR